MSAKSDRQGAIGCSQCALCERCDTAGCHLPLQELAKEYRGREIAYL